MKKRVFNRALPRMRAAEPKPNLIQDPTHILSQILQLRAETALLLGLLRLPPLDQDVGFDLAAELAAEVATHQLEAVLYVPHVERPHQKFLRPLPVVKILGPAVGDYHQDNQTETEEIVAEVGLVGLHHTQRQVVQQFFGKKLLATALKDQLVGSQVCI